MINHAIQRQRILRVPQCASEKLCPRCKIVKSQQHYSFCRKNHDGLQSYCKTCYLIYQQTNRDKLRIINRRYDRKYPVAYRARQVVRTEVRAGRLVSKPCFLCKEKKTEAHHLQPNKPLYIVWLCRQCHGAVHNNRIILTPKQGQVMSL